MMKKCFIFLMIFGAVIAYADVPVTTVDFLKEAGVNINGAGPVLVQADARHHRIIAAHTLSASLSVIDGGTHAVTNIPLAGRALQHLKAESMVLNGRTGEVCLIGARCFHIVSPENGTSKTIPTRVQFESIAVDEATGNLFVAGRENKTIGFYDAGTGELSLIGWFEKEEALINLNATPPPPIRKVVMDQGLRRLIAVDGYTSTLYVFDADSRALLRSRPMGLLPEGRWHLAGYNQETHCLYIVAETKERKVIQAAKIDVVDGEDKIIALPEFTEGVGIIYNPVREEVYVPYDNHPSVHVVDFNDDKVEEIKIPAYGNDGSAIDAENDLLYIASWAFGEVDVVDLRTRKLKKRITGLGIIPHMFTMTFNPETGLIYYPKGATAVNGAFGAAVCALDPRTEKVHKIYTGWAPIDLIEMKDRGTFLVFNSEDRFAEVRPDGSYEIFKLPDDYPVRAVHSPEGNVYLSYGPHQSYWPTVYIWGAKDGILTISADDLSFYDRRIPRQAHEMVLDKEGMLYFTQNNWGREEQFLGRIGDEVRVFDINKRLGLKDEVEREITQRVLRYNEAEHLLYLVRAGEMDEDPGILQIIDPVSEKVKHRIPVGRCPTDLVFDDKNIYVANFDFDSVSVIDKTRLTVKEIETGDGPLKLCRCGGQVYVINHLGCSLQEVRVGGKTYDLGINNRPDNLFPWAKPEGDRLVITAHDEESLRILLFIPGEIGFGHLHKEKYHYGDTRFDSRNVSFYMNGQFGDAVFSLSEGSTDKDGRLWVTDFLSGKLFIIGKGKSE